MKFRGHETFFIRKGWLYKGMNNVLKEPGIFQGAAGNPMDVLGIGANMVKSLRYWMTATNLTMEPKYGKKTQTLTPLGEIIFKNDAYMEEIGSILLIHYMLASNENEATSWYILFNEFNKSEFTVDDFHGAVIKYVRMKENSSIPSDRVIEDDFNCLMNTYVPRIKLNPAKIHPENNIDCPLGELGLIDVIDKRKRLYRKSLPKVELIPSLILLALIIDSTNQKEIRISSLQNDKLSIGKILNLDSITLINLLYKLEKDGYIKVIRTAGLDIIRIETDMDFLQCVQAYYDELNQ